MMLKKLPHTEIEKFHRFVYAAARGAERDFPWRKKITPYRVLISEIMLQQTQTSRVEQKYENFLRAFPTFTALANAPFEKVLREWSGLGYNRRALALKKLAEIVVREYGGKLPRDTTSLITLPGVGSYTARAVQAFAWNKPSVFIETNIRSVFIHYFFPRGKNISDKKILPLVEQTLDEKKPRMWYSALMDCGAALKADIPNPSRRSAHHVRQSPFKGSRREARGTLLKLLAEKEWMVDELSVAMKNSRHFAEALDELVRDGFIVQEQGVIYLSNASISN